MAVLPLSYSIRLHPHVQVWKGSLVNGGTKLQAHVLASATTTTPNFATNPTHKSNEVLKLNKIFDNLSLGPIGVVADQVLFKNKDTNKGNFDFSDFLASKPKSIEDDGLGEEVGIVMQRLKTVVEKMREMELEKLKSKNKGQTMSFEETMLAEDMSREIVRSFLEKPIEYLKGNCGNLEDKLKDLSFLVDILEESCGTSVVNKKIHVLT